MKIQLNAAARLAATQIKAASPGMQPELDIVMQSLSTVLGGKYKIDKRNNEEEVYWEFEGGRPPSGEHVLFAVTYNESQDKMSFFFEGEELTYESGYYKTAGSMIAAIKQWARSKHSDISIERSTLAKLVRLAAER